LKRNHSRQMSKKRLSFHSLVASAEAVIDGGADVVHRSVSAASSIVDTSEVALAGAAQGVQGAAAATAHSMQGAATATAHSVQSLAVSTEAVIESMTKTARPRTPHRRRGAARELSRVDMLNAVELASMSAAPSRSARTRGHVRRWLKALETFFGVTAVLYLMLITFDMLVEGVQDPDCTCSVRPDPPSINSSAGDGGACVAKSSNTPLYQSWFDFFTLADLGFLCLFSAEIVARLFVFGCDYLTNSPLNSVDALAVGVSLVLAVLGQVPSLPLSSGDFSIVRLFRVFRIVKVISAYNRIQQVRSRAQAAAQDALAHSKHPPSCNWEKATRLAGFREAKKYACFLSHYKVGTLGTQP
jgi:hypothetical protein